jgi:hypothetical protein
MYNTVSGLTLCFLIHFRIVIASSMFPPEECLNQLCTVDYINFSKFVFLILYLRKKSSFAKRESQVFPQTRANKVKHQ